MKKNIFARNSSKGISPSCSLCKYLDSKDVEFPCSICENGSEFVRK